MTTHIDDGFTGASGDHIHWQAWIPENPPIGVVVFSHGVGEHGGRYDWVAQQLASHGYASYAIDHQGHGKSGGKRCNIDSMDGVVADLHTLIGIAGDKNHGLPVYLLGHSMGALISMQYMSGSPAALRGLILSGAAVEITVGSALERLAASILSRLAPNLGVVAIEPSQVSRDPAVVHDYANDPLNHHGQVPARTGAEILKTAENLESRLPRIELPLLILQGTGDQIVSPSSGQILADTVSSTDLTFKAYDGLYHEVLNEPEKETVMRDVIEWLKVRP
ncbi:alpha/beta hydrolase [Smaragdicoccus niigatensis]|uniref:alpha/beta hydrolase n=1 Tax=Smaragdicoccus niigatensis TaxID=359359 RepID=UPI00036D45BF|nr:alpha/beta hydrolase [Smaragdicoccus niigatensis]